MFKNHFVLSLLISSVVGGGAANAMPSTTDVFASERVECPLTLQPQKPLGWSVVEKEPAHVLKRMAFFSGHPAYGAELVPQEHGRKGQLALDRWTFQDDVEHPWMACIYSGTSLMVARPVPSNVQFCDARYDVAADESHALKWVACRSN